MRSFCLGIMAPKKARRTIGASSSSISSAFDRSKFVFAAMAENFQVILERKLYQKEASISCPIHTQTLSAKFGSVVGSSSHFKQGSSVCCRQCRSLWKMQQNMKIHLLQSEEGRSSFLLKPSINSTAFCRLTSQMATASFYWSLMMRLFAVVSLWLEPNGLSITIGFLSYHPTPQTTLLRLGATF